MKLIDTISGAPAVAMLGMCKNAGKTTAMNTLIRDHPDQPYTTGLLIGVVITLVSAVLIGLRAAKDRRRNDCA